MAADVAALGQFSQTITYSTVRPAGLFEAAGLEKLRTSAYGILDCFHGAAIRFLASLRSCTVRKMTGRDRRKRFPARYLYMDVVVKRNGRWQIVGSQLARPARKKLNHEGRQGRTKGDHYTLNRLIFYAPPHAAPPVGPDKPAHAATSAIRSRSNWWKYLPRLRQFSPSFIPKYASAKHHGHDPRKV